MVVCPATILIGQTTDTLIEKSLEEITIVATRLPTSLSRSSRTIYQQELSQTNLYNQNLSADELFWNIPGVFALNPLNFAQDVRLSVRGFGSRAAFGIRGLKIIVDDIPATTPDGQSQLDHLQLKYLDKIEVIGGPGSSLYGNAAGGVIELTSKQLTGNGWGASLQSGSFGLLKSHLFGHLVQGKTSLQGNFDYSQVNGYRDHSRTETSSVGLKISQTIPRGILRWTLNYTSSPVAQDPGGIDLAQVGTDRKSARDRNSLYDAGEALKRGSVSMIFDKHISAGKRLNFKGYYVFRDFNNRLPFEQGGMVSFFRNYGGWQGQMEWSKGSYHLLLGSDLEYQGDLRERFDNLEGSQGPLVFKQLEEFYLGGIFSQQEIDFGDKWRMDLTMRLDLMQVRAKDRFLTDGDQSGGIDWSHFSPALGVNYNWIDRQFAFVRIGHNFETPALSELSNNPSGSGGFNSALLPQTANQLEVGVKGSIGNWRYQGVLFFIDLENELIPFELAQFPGRTFYRNSGHSTRTGLEFSIQGTMAKVLSLSGSYTYSNFRFADFMVNSNDLDGKRIPGIPQHFGDLGIHYQKHGFMVSSNLRYTGILFADDQNDVVIDDFILLHLRAGKQWQVRDTDLSLFGGIRNMTNTKYFDNVRINAFGGRFFEPAPLVNFFIGMDVSF